MPYANLFSPLTLGPYTVPNRVFLAPMTRVRATADGVPTPLAAEYYAQRAGGGLLITEATAISNQGNQGPGVPGLFHEAQVEGWKPVIHAVHARGGRIFAQLWHVGRSKLNAPDGVPPVSASAIPINGSMPTPAGPVPYPMPRALEVQEIPGVIADYRKAAEFALRAGFDGVELHAANGYLPDQFLRDGSNKRADKYGGSVENRARFTLEAAKELIAVFGPERVGVRLSPSGTYNDMRDSNPVETFHYVAQALDALKVVYLHLIAAQPADLKHGGSEVPLPPFRSLVKAKLIVNGGFDAGKAEAALTEGYADAVSFGVIYLANPDLPQRFLQDAPLNPPDFTTFYGGGAKGYTDYPTLAG